MQGLDFSTLSAERAAMLLALSVSREEEEQLKIGLERNGHYKCAVTELGAKLSVFRERVVANAIGAALNCGVVSKTPHHLHALVHATRDAAASFAREQCTNGDVAVKIGIVRDSQWIAVALFGEWADHALANHKCAGLGVMHIAF